MKLSIFIISLLFLISTGLHSYSQVCRINCIIFIDGKLPEGSSLFNNKLHFSSDLGDQTIEFDYVIGEIRLSSEDYRILEALDPKSEITIEYTWRKLNGRIITYSGVIQKHLLFYDFLIIRITNTNIRKAKYYFGYSTPLYDKVFHHKEYNMFMY